jgi:hypothetical protein
VVRLSIFHAVELDSKYQFIYFSQLLKDYNFNMHNCSIYKVRSTYRAKLQDKFLIRNLIRLAEVWMDDYKQYFYSMIFNQLVRTRLFNEYLVNNLFHRKTLEMCQQDIN